MIVHRKVKFYKEVFFCFHAHYMNVLICVYILWLLFSSALSTGGSRMLKGVMRVGVLAKGLIMREEPNVHLLILCASKPTHLLLNSIYSILPEKLAVSVPLQTVYMISVVFIKVVQI